MSILGIDVLWNAHYHTYNVLKLSNTIMDLMRIDAYVPEDHNFL